MRIVLRVVQYCDAVVVTSSVTQIVGQLSASVIFALFRITAAVVRSFAERVVPRLVSARLPLVAFIEQAFLSVF